VRPRWHTGDPDLCRRVERWLGSDSSEANPEKAELLAQSRYRRSVKLPGTANPRDPLFAKHFLSPASRRLGDRLLERFKAAAGQAAADREWRALAALHRQGMAVPEPLARASLAGREALLVARYVEGRPLLEALGVDPATRRQLLTALGELVARLHALGWTHGDLHAGNILVTGGRPLLVDWQRARRSRSEDRRLVDLGTLEFSLAQAGLSRSDRLRVRMAALGVADPRSPEARRQLRRAGHAAQARASRHYRRRTKRCLRVGEVSARVRSAAGRGLRLRDFPDAAIDEALAAHRAAIAAGGPALLKCDHRSRVSAVRAGGRDLVVKEVIKGGPRKWVADLFRGSPARRAWRGGHGLLVRGIGAALPLAFVERRALGLPVASFAILEDLRPGRPVQELRPDGDAPTAAELVNRLCDLAASLHRHGVIHGDFQALHVYGCEGASGWEMALIDLEGVRFPGRLREGQRIEALAELNASLPDDLISLDERLRGFERYAARLPFEMGADAARVAIARRSLERRHRWRGEGCELGVTIARP